MSVHQRQWLMYLHYHKMNFYSVTSQIWMTTSVSGVQGIAAPVVEHNSSSHHKSIADNINDTR